MTGSEYVAECLWPEVRESDLRALDERVAQHVQRLVAAGGSVRYLGSLLLREDEVVLCQFSGQLQEVREVVETTRVPYERILEIARSPWTTQAWK